MLVVISPAKRLDWTLGEGLPCTRPEFADDASALAAVARRLSAASLARLMGLSADLARLTHARFAGFSGDPDPARVRPAALAFAGDTYAGLRAASLTTADLDRARDHLRVLSGLYGLLRPMDGIQPYRLEMGSRLANPRGGDLYAFWGDRLAGALNAQERAVGTGTLLNCASKEYFRAVDPGTLELEVITPAFLEDREGRSRAVSFFAKKARGAMARFVVQNRIADAGDLRGFDFDGYAYDDRSSTPANPVFRRPYPTPARLRRAG